jgi:hypothetical protein
MNPEEDPEARIRQLEQPLAGYATELGANRPTEGVNPTTPLPPPAYGAPYQAPYQTSPYDAPPFGVSYPQVQKKGPPIGLIFGLLAVVVVLIFGGVGAFVWTMMSKNEIASTVPTYRPSEPDVAGGGGSVDAGADRPTVSPPTALPTKDPEVPEVAVAPAGGQYSVSGIDETETVECNGSNISVSGVNNVVTLRGHCLSVTVSGVENQVTLDTADRIGASGFDNQVIYHSGAPQVDATGGNIVTQG